MAMNVSLQRFTGPRIMDHLKYRAPKASDLQRLLGGPSDSNKCVLCQGNPHPDRPILVYRVPAVRVDAFVRLFSDANTGLPRLRILDCRYDQLAGTVCMCAAARTQPLLCGSTLGSRSS